jgi:centromeric protein E
MATAAISLLSRPSMAPPTSALPPLPTSKARRNMAPQPTAMPQNPIPSPTSLPLRSPLDDTAAAAGSAPALLHRPAPSLTLSSSQLAANSTRSSPTERAPAGTAGPHHGKFVTGNVSGPQASSSRDASPSALASPVPPPPGKDIRRTVSVAAFPHPPTRKSSLPVSPLSAGSIYFPATQGLRKAAMDGLTPSPPPALAAKDPPVSRLKRSRGAVGSNANLAGSIITSGIPQPSSTSNTANSSPDGNVNSPNLVSYGARNGNKPVSTASTAARGSDNLSSVQSPSLSRCSSAQGSDSTAPTTFEDSGDAQPRGREPEDESNVGQPRRQSKQSDGKGNVIVSVRVRPDAHGEHNKADGDWKVDGARSTITYRGREGGEYLYGM